MHPNTSTAAFCVKVYFNYFGQVLVLQILSNMYVIFNPAHVAKLLDGFDQSRDTSVMRSTVTRAHMGCDRRCSLTSIRFRRFIRKIRKEKKKRTILRVRDSLVFISPLFRN